MDRLLLEAIGQWVGSPVLNHTAIGGGDISLAYRVNTKSDVFFCKVQMKHIAYDMFKAESNGLEALRRSGVILAPQVYSCQKWGEGAVLIMEYLDSKRPSESELSKFGEQLAHLHQQPASYFGWESHNFIGSLPQSNTKDVDWSNFYVQERLQPQIKMAVEQGMLSSEEIPSVEGMTEVLNDLFSGLKPSLLHGDLWGGNYMISSDGVPYLIDPAVYYGHSEVDIAMSRLFGGFGAAFYSAYESNIPLDQYSDDRIRIYQLYYLLVHLNLFGRSYYTGVMSILKHYF